MSKIIFDGPVEVTPDLMMALWDSMPETGRQGVAQLFFSRFVSGTISDQALLAGAKVIFDKLKLSAAASKKLRDEVDSRCKQLVESMNESQAKSVMADELRKSMAKLAEAKAAELVALIGLDDVREMVVEASRKPVQELAHRYFYRVPEGQKRMLAMIDEAVEEEAKTLRDQIRAEMQTAVAPIVRGRITEERIAFGGSESVESGNGRADDTD